jgi:hypothetical protein
MAGLESGVFTGTVGGVTVPSDARYTLLSSSSDQTEVTFTQGMMRGIDNGDGTIDTGIIFTDPGSEFGGAVYYIGAGSDYVQDGPYEGDNLYTFRGLSTLGTCVGASGADTLSGCIR